MPREILQITPESTYGVYDDAGDHAIIDLPSDNAFTMRAALARGRSPRRARTT